MTNYLYLSPHCDDVALSCGGMLLRHAELGEPATVLTICAGMPDYTRLSAFARTQHRQWGHPRDPVATRRTEDAETMRRLGVSAQYLDVLDCIYRRDRLGRPLIYSNRTLYGNVHPDERPLIREIAHRIAAYVPRKRESVIVAPLAVGRHVDHQIVRDAVRMLMLEKYAVLWYEDFPYAEMRSVVTWARNAFGEAEWSNTIHPIEVEKKIEAICAYTTQLKSTFKNRRDMAARVRAYNGTVAGGDGFAERLWSFEPRR